MKNYVLLMKDQQTQLAYFYNMDDGYVYIDYQKEVAQGAGKGAMLGSAVGILCSGILGALGSIRLPKLAAVICVVSGLLLGICSYMLLNHNSFSGVENRQLLTKEQIAQLYEQGKAFRRSYLWMMIGFGAFSIAAAAFLFAVHKVILIICVILAWWIMGIMICGIRPILQMRIRKWLKDSNNFH